jgi:hypothetical protein
MGNLPRKAGKFTGFTLLSRQELKNLLRQDPRPMPKPSPKPMPTSGVRCRTSSRLGRLGQNIPSFWNLLPTPSLARELVRPILGLQIVPRRHFPKIPAMLLEKQCYSCFVSLISGQTGSYGEPQEDGPPIFAAHKFSLNENYNDDCDETCVSFDCYVCAL